jgi:hypothetical protein
MDEEEKQLLEALNHSRADIRRIERQTNLLIYCMIVVALVGVWNAVLILTQ